MHNLKFDLGHILKWFKGNSLKLNLGKFQFMILGTNTDIRLTLLLDGNKIEKSQEVVLLGITVDDELSFKHVEGIWWKIRYKLHALRHTREHLSTDGARTLCNAFTPSRFCCVPLIWAFLGKLLNSRVQNIHFQSLQVYITYMAQLMMNYFQWIVMFNSSEASVFSPYWSL